MDELEKKIKEAILYLGTMDWKCEDAEGYAQYEKGLKQRQELMEILYKIPVHRVVDLIKTHVPIKFRERYHMMIMYHMAPLYKMEGP